MGERLRTFETGATRDKNTGKPDYRGFLSWRAIKRFGAYMHRHRIQSDGNLRDADNWKKGIPIPSYLESLVRHVVDMADAYEAGRLSEADELACAVWFNVQGYLHERTRPTVATPGDFTTQAVQHGDGFGVTIDHSSKMGAGVRAGAD